MPPAVSERRSNVVFYGIPESPPKTSKFDRQKHELGIVVNTLSGIDSSITSASIKDIYRLGKFKPDSNRPRPILVKFLRNLDATMVLSSKRSITSSEITIKPDMTYEERKTETVLLKERRTLINQGVERKHIRLRGNSIYVNNKLHGTVQNFELSKQQLPMDTTTVPNAQPSQVSAPTSSSPPQ